MIEPIDRPEPTPPTNVRVVLKDNTEVPVQTVYIGFVNQVHTWEVVERLPHHEIAGMKVETLPPHTGITVAVGW